MNIKFDEIDEAILNSKKDKALEFTSKQDKKEFEEIETIIDQALIETEINEIKEMNRDITNKEILVEALRNRSNMIDIKDLVKKAIEVIEKGNVNADSFFKKTWKLFSTIAILMFLSGYSLAVFQHENIKPFIGDIVKEAVKRVTHTDGGE